MQQHSLAMASAFQAAIPVRIHLSARSQKLLHSPQCALNRRALGVDYGLARTGVAVSVGLSPRALPTICTNDPAVAAREVAAAARAALAPDIVIGLPLRARGDEGPQAEAARNFAALVKSAAPWARIHLLDERFSSAEAKENLHQRGFDHAKCKEIRDAEAAAVILNRFFSNADEVRAELYAEPSVQERLEECKTKRMSSLSYAQWQKEAREKAARCAKQLAEEKSARRKRRAKR